MSATEFDLSARAATQPIARFSPRYPSPEIICLCGSSRYVDIFAILMWELEKKGAIALGLHLLPMSYPGVAPDHQAEAEGIKEKMDELHMRKIDLCDRVMIVNVDGYFGNSTRREIAYARSIGKPISFLEALEDIAARLSRKSPHSAADILKVLTLWDGDLEATAAILESASAMGVSPTGISIEQQREAIDYLAEKHGVKL